MWRFPLFCAALLLLPRTLPAGEKLVLLGGGPRPPAALARFVEWAGNGDSRLLVVTWASVEPLDSYLSIERDLRLYRPASIEAAPFAPLGPGDKPRLLASVRRATGIFFGGGDQGRIMDVLQDRDLSRALRERYRSGVVFGGTSAGTAVMSALMITGAGDPTVVDGRRVEVRAGLGLLPGVILDQHFLKRQRQNRLFGLVLDHPRLLGIGVDEGTALAVSDNRHAEVVGPGSVMMVDAVAGTDDLVVSLVRPGETFDLKTRRRNRVATGAGG
ncbi:MAG TPA: cyanophycinase [Vicinamibacteria bacterium]|nr:cyanophycinase [Vicinamibacteria bacterium]